ncbi:MAG: hypothetical protein KTR30_33005 [Saprospiraceae bacterium]|nr:hypothetical protein [Saprospiraceae bacterium]
MSNWKLPFILILGLAIPTIACSQKSNSKDLKKGMISPYEVLKWEDEIGLSPLQKDSLRQNIKSAELKFDRWNRELEIEMDKMAELLKRDNVSERVVLRQMDSILSIEKKIKKEQLILLFRTKKSLSKRQKQEIKVKIKIRK